MKSRKSLLALTVASSALAGGLLATSTASASQLLDVAAHNATHASHSATLMAEGKCGEGKCGEGKSGEGKSGEGKCGEGKCGEGKCGEGKCGGAAKDGDGKGAKEAKCGEGKCGGGK